MYDFIQIGNISLVQLSIRKKNNDEIPEHIDVAQSNPLNQTASIS